MSSIPWYQTFFADDYLRIYLPFLTPERTARDVAGILNLLQLPPGSAMLDLCCGHGRHALILAQHGYRLTGQDLSKPFLQRAEAEANSQALHIHWVQSDMKYIPFENEFDAVINIFTSFGYLENEDEDQQVLQQVHKSLKPGGLFLIETVYQPRVMRNFTPHSIIRYDDGLIVLEERSINVLASRNEVRITMLLPNGQYKEYHQSMRIYTLTELARMFARAGLELQAYYGGLDGTKLTMDSRLVVLGRKTYG